MRHIIENRGLRGAPLTGLIGVVLLAACSNGQGGNVEDEGKVGALGLALTVEGYTVSQVTVSITSDDPQISRQRDFDVSDANATVSFTEHGLPPATYSIGVTATIADDPTTTIDESTFPCAGSTSGVVVQAGQVKEVNDLVLLCTVPGGVLQQAGSISVNATTEVEGGAVVNGDLGSAFIGPLQTSVGGTVTLTAEPVEGATVEWSTNAGTIAPDGSSLTGPALAGQVTVTATFTKGDITQRFEEVVSFVSTPVYSVGEAVVQSYPVLGVTQFLGVVFDAAGNFYTVGPTSPGVATENRTAVAKFLPSGALDTTWADNGFAIVDISPGGTEAYRGIVIQTTGGQDYIVVGGTATFVTSEGNLQDLALARFKLSDGSLDTSFGTGGIVRHDLSVAEAAWNIVITQGDKIAVHTSIRRNNGANGETDNDNALVRLNADGSLDTSFGGTGIVSFDIGNASQQAREVTALPDGSLVGAGYQTSTVLPLGVSSQQPILFKVLSDGSFDADFATEDPIDVPGVFHDYVVPPPLRAEVYAAAPQGGLAFVGNGYGPTIFDGTGTDVLVSRYTLDGRHDKTFGTNGVTYLDPGGLGDNGRSILVLPDNQILAVGGGRASGNSTNVDGFVGLLSEGGLPVASFGPNGKLYELGGAADFLWGSALSPDNSQVVLVGLGGNTGATSGIVLRLPLSTL